MGLKVRVYGVKGESLWGKGVGLWGKGESLWGNPFAPNQSKGKMGFLSVFKVKGVGLWGKRCGFIGNPLKHRS